jgi:TRAP-type C4-dicarboxylate transport system permease small subunit
MRSGSRSLTGTHFLYALGWRYLPRMNGSYVESVFKGLMWFEKRVMTPIFMVGTFGILSLAVVAVALRYIWGISYQWQSDYMVYFFIAFVFLHLGITERNNSHLKMTLLFEVLTNKGLYRTAGILRMVAAGSGIIYLGFFVYWGYNLMSFARSIQRVTESRALKIWPFYLSMIVGHAMFLLWVLYRFKVDYRAFIDKTPYSTALLARDEALIDTSEGGA